MSIHELVAAVLALAALTAAWLLVLGVRRRRHPGGRGLILVSGSLLVWTTSNAVQTLTSEEWLKRLTLSITFTAICGVTIGAWWCMTELVRRPRMTRLRWALVLAPVPVMLFMIWTGWRDLLFEELLIPAGQGPVDNEPGPWYAVQVLWAYALIGGSLALFAIAAIRARGQYRRQGVLMVVAVSLPLLANVLTVTRLYDFGGYDATPITMLATAVGVTWGIRRLRLIDTQIGLLPVAPHVVVRAMRDGVVVVDEVGRVLELNPAARELLGADAAQAIGAPARHLIAGWDAAASAGTWEYTLDGRVLEVSATPIDDAHDRQAHVAIIRDVTERRHAEAALAESARLSFHQSRHDPLTGLANRTLLFERLRDALDGDPQELPGIALLILDLDGFKELNDSFGHRAGDEALRELAARLIRVTGEHATVARLAGDEFAVILPGRDPESAVGVAFRILDAIRVPFSVEGTEIGLGASIGVALFPDHGTAADHLVHAADVAMYHAKRHASGVALYASSDDVRRPDRMILRQELRTAIAAGELVLHYQPQCGPDGAVQCLEALVRWRHPRRGLLMPGEFLAIAEESDLVCELTDTVLDLAMRDLARWAAAAQGLRVAVNISSRDLRDAGLPERVRAALGRHAVPPTALTLEVTENGLATSREAAAQLTTLRAEGVRVSLDDFGTGFAPLATLRRLPVDELKIDRSFVHEIDHNERDAALTAGLIRLGHDLGLTVVAEGVETRRAAEQLADLGCDLLQGFLVGRPGELGELTSLRPSLQQV